MVGDINFYDININFLRRLARGVVKYMHDEIDDEEIEANK